MKLDVAFLFKNITITLSEEDIIKLILGLTSLQHINSAIIHRFPDFELEFKACEEAKSDIPQVVYDYFKDRFVHSAQSTYVVTHTPSKSTKKTRTRTRTRTRRGQK